MRLVATYLVNDAGVAFAEQLIRDGKVVLESDWGRAQPSRAQENEFLQAASWEEYSRWHLGLTDGAGDGTKGRYAFVFGDFDQLHRMGLIATVYRASEWRHKAVELAAHDLLQLLDRTIEP